MDTIRSADGTPIAFARSGEGPPLVLVHGTTGTHRRWAPVLPRLQARCTVVAVERRGRGESGDAAAYAMEREFEDVAAVLAAQPEPPFLLGHSFGAICALEAARRAGNVCKLVLCEPPMPSAAHPVLFAASTLDRLQAMLEAGDPEG